MFKGALNKFDVLITFKIEFRTDGQFSTNGHYFTCICCGSCHNVMANWPHSWGNVNSVTWECGGSKYCTLYRKPKTNLDQVDVNGRCKFWMR